MSQVDSEIKNDDREIECQWYKEARGRVAGASENQTASKRTLMQACKYSLVRVSSSDKPVTGEKNHLDAVVYKLLNLYMGVLIRKPLATQNLGSLSSDDFR